ncbi:MAG: hypothetical protein CM15mP102_22180 [Flavobacteriales bacterium]|nr:MAG: hypothetical protein CM15mP102_22180 [Flavobacteriales bacterium]
MVVHPGHGNYSGTLINALLYHFDNLPKIHLIDLVLSIELTRTRLVFVIAKTEESMTFLAKQFLRKQLKENT